MAEFTGTEDGDDIIGGEEGDTLTGGRGADTLTGGGGADLFIIDDADSSATGGLGDLPGVVDVVTDFTAEDRVVFRDALAPEEDSLFAGVADDYGAAYDMAQTAFADGFEYASIKVGSDVFVFAPRADSVILLAGVDPEVVTSASFSSDISGGEEAILGVAAEGFDGGTGNDTVFGMEGADTLIAHAGADQVFGGLDDDSIDGGEGRNYLRGDEGDDAVTGGAQHDDINGNTGRDTLMAGAGDDWVRGGKDDDVVFGNAGADLVFGDAGRDTLDGGIGADVFVAQAGSGDDVVIDFSADSGDQVFIAAGTAYSVFQEGANTVIQMDFSRMVLNGVQLSSLPTGWLVEG